MNLLVADTDVVSFEIKNDSRAELYRELLNNHLTSISFMTLAELNVWAISSGWGAHRMNEFHKSIENYIVLDSRHDISRIWAETTISVKKRAGTSRAPTHGMPRLPCTTICLWLPTIAKITKPFLDLR